MIPATLSVHLAPNQPQLTGRQVLIVDRDRDLLDATIDLELHVEQGLVDVLRFDVPPQFQLDQNAQGAVANSQREQTPIGDTALGRHCWGLFSPRSRTAGPSMATAWACRCHPPRPGQIDKFVVLPQQWEREQVIWISPALLTLNSQATCRNAWRYELEYGLSLSWENIFSLAQQD